MAGLSLRAAIGGLGHLDRISPGKVFSPDPKVGWIDLVSLFSPELEEVASTEIAALAKGETMNFGEFFLKFPSTLTKPTLGSSTIKSI